MNPGSSPLIHAEKANDNAQNLYIPMSPGPHHFDLVGLSSATLPVHKGGAMAQCHRRLSEIQPPPVNRNLKPDRKGKNSCLWANLSRNSSILVIFWIASVVLCTLSGVTWGVICYCSTVRPSDLLHPCFSRGLWCKCNFHGALSNPSWPLQEMHVTGRISPSLAAPLPMLHSKNLYVVFR